VNHELARLQQTERWIAWVRLLSVPVAVVEVGSCIARSIAEAHGGTLDLRADPGAGATFTVRLPVPGSA
jgi:light-regulated signal transduction histidine kinase (bacteriophytochrome)